MEIFNNTTKVVKDNLVKTIKCGDRISIAAACFSIYAYQELKKQLESCEERRTTLYIHLSYLCSRENTERA